MARQKPSLRGFWSDARPGFSGPPVELGASSAEGRSPKTNQKGIRHSAGCALILVDGLTAALWSSWWNRTAPGRRNFDLNHKDHQDHEVDAIKYEFGDKLWRVALLYAALRRRAIFLQRSMEKNIES